GSEEEVVAAGEELRDVVVDNVAWERFVHTVAVRFAPNTPRDLYLGKGTSRQDEPRGVGPPAADDARVVRDIEPVRVHDRDPPDAQGWEVLVKQRADAASADDPDVQRAQQCLTPFTEETRLSVICRIDRRRSWRGRLTQFEASRAHNHRVRERRASAVGQPEVPCDCLRRDDDPADHSPLVDLCESGVATLVRGHVVSGEACVRAPAVTVQREVSELFADAEPDLLTDKRGGEHAVTALAGHIVDTVLRKEDLAHEQAVVRAPCDAGGEDRTMLIAVARKQVRPELVVEPLRQNEGPAHGCFL